MKIYSKNRITPGFRPRCRFCNGRGETDDPYLIEWFRSHGYRVEEEAVQEADAEKEEEAKMGPKKPARAKGD
mgnify:CR=1 FL=1